MLTAAVCGSIFASPPPSNIECALKLAKSPAGCLVIVKNYTGDRINFGLAVEKLKSENFSIEMIVIGKWKFFFKYHRFIVNSFFA